MIFQCVKCGRLWWNDDRNKSTIINAYYANEVLSHGYCPSCASELMKIAIAKNPKSSAIYNCFRTGFHNTCDRVDCKYRDLCEYDEHDDKTEYIFTKKED